MVTLGGIEPTVFGAKTRSPTIRGQGQNLEPDARVELDLSLYKRRALPLCYTGLSTKKEAVWPLKIHREYVQGYA